MNSERPKLRQEQRAEQKFAIQEQARHEAREFATVEELLRLDNELNPVPPEVAERVNASLRAEPRPKKPWYKALFKS
jgi:hypothetical protein